MGSNPCVSDYQTLCSFFSNRLFFYKEAVLGGLKKKNVDITRHINWECLTHKTRNFNFVIFYGKTSQTKCRAFLIVLNLYIRQRVLPTVEIKIIFVEYYFLKTIFGCFVLKHWTWIYKTFLKPFQKPIWIILNSICSWTCVNYHLCFYS